VILSEQGINDKLRIAVLAGDEQTVKDLVRVAIEGNADAIELVEKGLIPAIKEVGEKFDRMEIFLADMMLSANAMKSGMDLLLPKISKEKIPRRGRVVVGTVRGDIHEIGKTILGSLLTASGLEVHDIGCDVPASAFVTRAEQLEAEMVMASALMTTTLPGQRDILEYLATTGKRARYLVLVGGGATTREWADEIGADGYAETAMGGVELAGRKLEERRNVHSG
jgi:trimethylamine corrinoid protein